MNGNGVDIIATLTGENWFVKTTRAEYPARDQVAQLAYRLYEARGRQDGHDVEDWLLAEDRLVNGSGARRYHASLSTDNGGEVL
jgi:hypothetical protein